MSNLKHRLKFISSIIALTLASPVLAQTREGTAEIPLIVTGASLVPLEASRVGASVSVVTGEQIAARKIQTITEALALVPGLEINSTGTRGTLSEIRIRGAETRHGLIVIDGVPVNSVTSGGFNFADLMVEDVERIEVIKGPQSAIYGPEANSGVIAITTKSGRKMKPELRARMEYGSFDTAFGAFSMRGQQGPFYGSAGFQGYLSSGYNISRFGTERDASNAQQANIKFGYDPSEQFNIETSLIYSQRRAASDSATVVDQSIGLRVTGDSLNDYSMSRRISGRVAATYIALDGAWTHKLGTSFMSERDTFLFTGGSSMSDGSRNIIDYNNAYKFDTGPLKNTLITGFDSRWETYQNPTAARPSLYSRNQTGIFGELITDLPTDTTLSGTVRHDWNDQFANFVTWRLALSQRLAITDSRLHASIGRGVTNPSFTNMFAVFTNLATPFVGNPNLLPETSIGFDAGVEQKWFNGRLITDVTYFHSDFTNRIASVTQNGVSTVVNDPAISTRDGIEVAAKAKITEWLSVSGSYTYTNAQSPTNLAEVRRPWNTVAGSLAFSFPDYRTNANITLSYMGDSVNTATPAAGGAAIRVIMPPVALLSASVTHDLNRFSSVYLRGENLTNVQYDTVFGFRAPGASVFAGLTVKYNE